MYKGYKIVCNTAAGRRRYMQYLLPPVIASDWVDRYDIWVNTNNACDIDFFKQVSKRFPKVNLIWQPDGVVNGIKSINAFYRSCIDEDTIYIKLDDDIVWLEPDYFEKMVVFRIENPDYFLVSPMVINNALCTYIMQVCGKLSLSKYMNARANHSILWRSGSFAVELHAWFLNKYLKVKKYEQLYCGKKPIALNRFSINSILWFGSEMKKFHGVVEGDDEEFLSVIKPAQLGLSNCLNCDALISHFAFRSQREYLDSKNILEQYGAYLFEEWKEIPPIENINQIIQSIMLDVKGREQFLLKQELLYKEIMPTPKQVLRIKYKDIVRRLRLWHTNLKSKKYIVES